MVPKINNPARRALRLKAAAQYLSVSPRCVRTLVQKGELPLVQIAESTHAPWLIDSRDLDALIERRKVTMQ
jgi:predicted DNA-binding transcriptional regulator AlpA